MCENARAMIHAEIREQLSGVDSLLLLREARDWIQGACPDWKQHFYPWSHLIGPRITLCADTLRRQLVHIVRSSNSTKCKLDGTVPGIQLYRVLVPPHLIYKETEATERLMKLPRSPGQEAEELWQKVWSYPGLLVPTWRRQPWTQDALPCDSGLE